MSSIVLHQKFLRLIIFPDAPNLEQRWLPPDLFLHLEFSSLTVQNGTVSSSS
jgi:hypothetical protein